MDLFTAAAPIFDLAMKISGHNKILVELGDRIKKDELNKYSGEKFNQSKENLKSDNNFKINRAKLLDLGGGTGELANYLPQNLEVTVADPSQAMLEKLKEKKFKIKVEYQQADGADLPFADNSFDYLTISDALHHFRDVKKALAESKRVLKPGGKIYILEFDPKTFFTKVIIFFEKIMGEPVNFYQPKKLEELLREDGLKTECEYLNKSLYFLRAEKSEN